MDAPPAAAELVGSAQARNLALATLAFGVNFWAWSLVSNLAMSYRSQLGLSVTQTAVLVAMPVLVGSVGRIPIGAMTDRLGGRRMFALVSSLAVVPVLAIPLAGSTNSYRILLIAAFLLGITGSTFAVGIPFVSAWFEPSRRGLATGVIGAGMGGAALSALFTPRLVDWVGYRTTHLLMAAALVVVAFICWTLMADSPRWTANADPALPKLAAALRLPVTWQMSALYAITLGGMLAFVTYLPTYLGTIYGYNPNAAGARTAGFAIAAVAARPIGGILSDRLHPKPVVLTSLACTAALALVIVGKPTAEIPAGLAFVTLALSLGVGTGAVLAWVTRRAPTERLGSVAGIVGAAGGLGGFFPPLVMGATYDAAQNDYTTGLSLLCATAVLSLLLVARLRQDEPSGG